MQRFFVANNDGVTVNFPAGKLSKDNAERKSAPKQKGNTCTIYAMRRLAFFNPSQTNETQKQAYKILKKNLSESWNYSDLKNMGEDLVRKLNIYLPDKLLEQPDLYNIFSHYLFEGNYSVFDIYLRLPARRQWCILYDILVRHFLIPFFNLKNSDWHPHQGFAGLVNSLKTNGPHVFFGKLGSWTYLEKPFDLPSESTPMRRVRAFKKNSYHVAKDFPLCHAVIVDQAKIINGKAFVFFHDPNRSSILDARQIVYILSYDAFIERLTNNYNKEYVNTENRELSYGIVSQNYDEVLRPRTP